MLIRSSTSGPTLSNTIAAMEELRSALAYSKEMLGTFLGATDADLNNSGALAELLEAYKFFECMKKGQKYVAPDGRVVDFSKFSTPQGFFGAKTAEFEALLNNILKSFDKFTLRDGWGDDQTIMNKATGQPATLFDLITNPNGNYSFNFWMNAHPFQNKDVDWCDHKIFAPRSGTLPPKAFNLAMAGGGSIYVQRTGSTWDGYNYTGTTNGNTILANAPIGISDRNVLKARNDALGDFLHNRF